MDICGESVELLAAWQPSTRIAVSANVMYCRATGPEWTFVNNILGIERRRAQGVNLSVSNFYKRKAI